MPIWRRILQGTKKVSPAVQRNVSNIARISNLDLRYDEVNNQIIIDKSKISKDDKTSGIKSCGEGLARQLIKNTYKTLLTRGQKGCFIYCEDKALSRYIKKMINKEGI